MKTSGIYKIVNRVNEKYYVGSSKNVDGGSAGRWSRHTRDLNKNRHHNIFLQRAWNKHGQQNFDFTFIEYVEPVVSSLLLVEQKYLDIAKTEPEKCYNLNFMARGGEWNEYTKRKMSILRTGEGNPRFGTKHSEETIKKMKIAQTGEKHSMFGKHPTKESRLKMSKSHIGEKNHFLEKLTLKKP
jgi:group I intron endonuclease